MKKNMLGLRGAVCLALLLPNEVLAQISFQLSTIARPGDAAPVPAELVQVSAPTLNDSGQVAFEGDSAVFLRSQGTTTIVAAFGDPAPGGGTFIDAHQPALNAQGQVVFFANVTPPSRPGIFLFTGAAIIQVVASGDPAPGGGLFSSFREISLNAAGEVVFSAFLFPSDEGLFRSSQGTIGLVARRGQPAPGGGTFSSFFSPVINSEGKVAFFSFLTPVAAGVFLVTDGKVTAVARSGDPAPAGGTFVFSSAGSQISRDLDLTRDARGWRGAVEPARAAPSPDAYAAARLDLGNGGATMTPFATSVSINDLGDVAFAALASVFGRGGIFVFSSGQITRRVRELDPAPGGGAFSYVDSPSLNASGQIAFRAAVSDGVGVFLLFSKGVYQSVARSQQPSPEGDLFTSAFGPSLNSVAQVAFMGQFANRLPCAYLYSKGSISRVAGQGEPVDRTPQFVSAFPHAINAGGQTVFSAPLFPGGSGLFDGPQGLIVRLGDPAPEGGVFTFVFQPTLNDSDQTVFVGYTTRAGAGLYSSVNRILSRIAASGDPAPGGGTFYGFYQPSINSNADVAFLGFTFAPSRSGLFVLSGGQFRSVVASGDPAPGGGTFTELTFPSLNDLGQVAFSASVAAPGRSGIFLWSEGGVQAIAQTGDSTPCGGTFNYLSFQSSLYAPSLNASSQVAFGAPLSTGSTGMFLSSSSGIDRIACPGDPAPGGGTIVFADSASLNDVGQVAFPASVTADGLGAYLFSGDTLSKIARPGDPAPGGGTFGGADFPKINAQARAAFVGVVSGNYGTFLATPVR